MLISNSLYIHLKLHKLLFMITGVHILSIKGFIHKFKSMQVGTRYRLINSSILRISTLFNNRYVDVIQYHVARVILTGSIEINLSTVGNNCLLKLIGRPPKLVQLLFLYFVK